MKDFITWILAANSEEAHFLKMEGRKLYLLQTFEHKEAREKVSEIVTDRAGRSFSSVAPMRHAVNEGQDVQRHEREKFASELFRQSKKFLNEDLFDRLVVIAPPQFLGELRSAFRKDSSLTHSIVKEIPKEVSPDWSMQKKMSYISSCLEPA